MPPPSSPPSRRARPNLPSALKPAESSPSVRVSFSRFISARQVLSTPKQWHGAPVATLRRGMLVLGGGRVQSLDAETRSQLELFRNLCFLNDEEYSPADHSKQMQSVVQRGQKRSQDDEQGGPNKLRQFRI
ncbi:hypothetical protein ACJ73_04204 [Blastomyces percursus]|uniref:Uncharacterized protein n=1 Tax=Blastomyces percursus TaxID=1658174 RepID=A0A1J9R9U9_9EURO|nr:hypothetical protein ACJ73_04204 [Blastomyces percursus]